MEMVSESQHAAYNQLSSGLTLLTVTIKVSSLKSVKELPSKINTSTLKRLSLNMIRK